MIQSIRGMHDYLQKETSFLQYIEEKLKNVLSSYGYSEIRIPIVEYTQLFKRAIGELTDVVEKEMYTFNDNKGESVTLRPEGTAGCVRASIQHRLLSNNEQRLWYIGPMFRYERPQKGRYRQFHQLGIEVFNNKGPYIDAELIMLTARWWKILGISKYLSLEINSIGSLNARNNYCKALVSFLANHKNMLDKDCLRRMYKNPMRVLDSKNANINRLLNDAPLIYDYIDDDAKKHFDGLCKILELSNISYIVNPRLVRGIDYYNYTVFEWVSTNFLQCTLCAGGRYDSLVEQLGGRDTPAIGCAIGLERLMMLLEAVNPAVLKNITPRVDAYIVAVGDNVQRAAILLAEKIRDVLPKLRLMTNVGNGNFSKQFSIADKHGARIALVLGEYEVSTKKVVLKDLTSGNQEILEQRSVTDRLSSLFKK